MLRPVLKKTYCAWIVLWRSGLKSPCHNLYVISLMKQQFVVTNCYTILRQTDKTWPILLRPTLKHVVFLQKCKDKHFLWTQHLTEGVFSTQLSSNVVISVWWIEWVTTHCCFVGNIQFNLLAISSEMFACACHTLWDNWAVMGNVLIIPVLVLELLVINPSTTEDI